MIKLISNENGFSFSKFVLFCLLLVSLSESQLTISGKPIIIGHFQ